MHLATTHLGADLDGVASLVALSLLEPGIELVVPGSMEETTRRFWKEQQRGLPKIHTLSQLRAALKKGPIERLLVVDTASPDRIGELAKLVDQAGAVLAFDTHPPADDDLPRAPMPEVAACISALVLRLAEEALHPAPEQAGLFLLGIHQDTGHFTYSGTRPLDHRAAALCHGWGAPLDWVARYIPKGFTKHQLGLLEAMAKSVDFVDGGGLDVAVLSLDQGEYEPDLSALVEQLRAAEEWPAALLLAGSGERISVIGRSDGALDLASLLSPFGGGGHPQAASATLRGLSLQEARAIVRGALEEALGGRRSVGDVAVHPFVDAPERSTIREAGELIHQRRIDTLPLFRGRGKKKAYTALVTRRETDAALALGLGERPVSEIAALSPEWLAPSAPLADARSALIAGPRRLLLVGEPPAAEGIVTRGVVFRAFEESSPDRAGIRMRPKEVSRRLRAALGERWAAVRALGALAGERGTSLHLVGGAVRDLFLERPIHDIDLIVGHDAPGFAKEAAEALGGEVKIHGAFGTASWTGPDGTSVDLASARYEHYEKLAALPQVALEAGLRQDLFRRDFTINAMAISVDPQGLGTLHDPYGGLEDLREGLLRVLHGLSFHDDPTRGFRAARFAARFDFRLAPETFGLLRAAQRAGAFERLGQERLGAELDRLLEEPAVVQAFRLLREWGLTQVIHPRFSASARFLEQLGRGRDACARLEGLSGGRAPAQAEVLWLAVASAIPAEDRRGLERLVVGGARQRRRFREGPEKVREIVTRLGRTRRGSWVARMLEPLDAAELGWALALSLGGGGRAQGWVEWWLREGRAITPVVDGDRLIEMGFRQGPKLGRALEAARDAAWDGDPPGAQIEAARRILRRGSSG